MILCFAAARANAGMPVAAFGCWPDTGQDRCYTGGNIGYETGIISCPAEGEAYYGQDAQFSGNQPRYVDNGDGTVTDMLTGLVWLKDASCADLAGTDGSGHADWATALTAAAALANGTCGLTDGSVAGDWHLPSVNELQSLIDYEYYGPALSNAAGTAQWTEGDVFAGVQSAGYWSSTSYADGPSDAWSVGLGYGYVYSDGKTGTYCVWPVRVGQ